MSRDNFYNRFYGTERVAPDIFRDTTMVRDSFSKPWFEANAMRAGRAFTVVSIFMTPPFGRRLAEGEGLVLVAVCGGGIATRYIRVNNARPPRSYRDMYSAPNEHIHVCHSKSLPRVHHPYFVQPPNRRRSAVPRQWPCGTTAAKIRAGGNDSKCERT